jgi:predicted PhzF superfamily epimerase YddE/YHI9
VPDPGLVQFRNQFGKVGVYVFSPLSAASMEVRFFFGKNQGSIAEDPATGSACANLGGFALLAGAALPMSRTLSQGAQTGRPSRLKLEIGAAREILVGGEVIELGRGYVDLPVETA